MTKTSILKPVDEVSLLQKKLKRGAEDMRLNWKISKGLAQKKAASYHIEQILCGPNQDFELTIEHYLKIHNFLFAGVADYGPGMLREYPLKYYASSLTTLWDYNLLLPIAPENLRQTWEYVLNYEKNICNAKLSQDELVIHFAKLHAALWVIHFVGNGNTRTSTVFMIQYLRMMGYNIDNTFFSANAHAFKTALFFACFGWGDSVPINDEPLFLFYRNMLLGEDNKLIDY